MLKMTGKMLAYTLDAKGFLHVSDWGEPSRHAFDCEEGEMQRVDYRDILWVTAYVRDFSAYRRPGIEPDAGIQKHGWTHWASYPIRNWCYIRDVFDE